MPPRARVGRWGLAAFLALSSCVWLLYGRAVGLWWTFDDLFHARFLLHHSPFQILASPATWRELPFRMFTPAQFLSYQADLAAFGLRPAFFYVHQLVALAAAAAAIFWVLRLWLDVFPAFAGSLLFVLGAPLIVWAQELMLRHYVEGLVWACIAVWCFVRSVRERRPALSIVSAVFYLAAMLSKEVYVPLLGVLLLLPEEEVRDRVPAARPHLVALAVYLAWRYAMLGTLGGGYGWAIRPEELPGLALSLPRRLAATFLGSSLAVNALLACALGAGAAVALRRSRRAFRLFAVSVLLIVLPVLAVAKSFDARFGALPWLAVVAAFAGGCQKLLHGGARARMTACILVLTAVATAYAVTRSVWRPRLAAAERMSAEEVAFLGMKGGELLRHPRAPPAAMNSLRWFKEDYLGLSRGSGWFDDDLYLCAQHRPIRGIWQYEDATRSMTNITSTLPSLRTGYCAALRNAPLDAAFRYQSGDFFWDLGPYATGQYAIVYGDGVERYDVQRHDGYRRHAAVMTLRVRYASPDGWITFSPNLALDFRKVSRLRWDRDLAGAR